MPMTFLSLLFSCMQLLTFPIIIMKNGMEVDILTG